MPKSPIIKPNVAVKQIRFTLDLPVAHEKAWKALVADTDKWWPADFRAAGPGSRVIFEPRLGGRLFEDSGNGNGVVWYQVIGLDAPRSVTMSGVIAPPFGGPATTLMRLSIEAKGEKKCILEIHDSLFGCIEGCDVETGWRALFGSLAGFLN